MRKKLFTWMFAKVVRYYIGEFGPTNSLAFSYADDEGELYAVALAWSRLEDKP